MSRLQLTKAIAYEAVAKRTMERSIEKLKALSPETIGHATSNGGRVDGRVAAGYLFQTEHISKTVAHCQRVLDIGSGTGEQLLQVAQVNPYVSFVGIDSSEFLVRKGREQATRLGIENVEFVVGDVSQLGCADHSFDGAISTMTLHYFPSHQFLNRALVEIRRVVAPGGAIYLEDFTLFKSQKTLEFFSKKDRPKDPDSFSELYKASMHAAFPISDLVEAVRNVFDLDVQIFTTFPIPFLAVIKTQSFALDNDRKERIDKIKSQLNSDQRQDYEDLKTAFHYGGL